MSSTSDQPETSRIQPLDVVIDGTMHGLFGIAHDAVTHSTYARLLSENSEGRDNWLMEQGMGLYMRIKDGIELSDYAANSGWGSFKEGLPGATIAIPLIGYIAWRAINPKKTVQDDLARHAKTREEFQEPTKPYDHSTRRSGYQAAFMRAWKEGQDKNLLVGAAHVPAVGHFLREPIDDNFIVDLASGHAELLERDPEKYKWTRRYHLGKEGASLAGGMVVGALPYLVGISVLKSL